MLAVQHRLSLIRPRSRSVRRAFHPSQDGNPYRLPHDVRDRLIAALAPFRNRDAAFALAVFVARFWSSPGRVSGAFPIDRRALADHAGLELTEARVRGAIRVLEEIGFLDRALVSGSTYKPTEDGLRRKPIRYVFGSDFFPLFDAANKRAAVARGRRSPDRRPIAPGPAQRASMASFQGSPLKSPKSRSEAETRVIMGEVIKESGIPPTAFEPNPKLEAALDRLLQGFRQSRGGSGEGSAR